MHDQVVTPPRAPQVLVKDVVSKIKLSTWGLVFYNNLLSFFVSIPVWPFPSLRLSRGRDTPAPALLFWRVALGFMSERLAPPQVSVLTAPSIAKPAAAAAAAPGGALLPAVVAVGTSCLFGFGISFCGLSVRRRVSATAFTVMGCTCKLATLLVNQLVWDAHATLLGQAFALLSIFGGVLYSEFAKRDAQEKAASVPKKLAPAAPAEAQGEDDDGTAQRRRRSTAGPRALLQQQRRGSSPSPPAPAQRGGAEARVSRRSSGGPTDSTAPAAKTGRKQQPRRRSTSPAPPRAGTAAAVAGASPRRRRGV